jgi:hypothetical protein
MKNHWILLGLMAVLLGPIGSTAHAQDGTSVFLRFLHGLSLESKVDIFVDGKKIHNDVEFGGLTPYRRLPAGSRSIEITSNNPTQTIILTRKMLNRDNFYTMGLYGTPRNLRSFLANDSAGYSSYGNARLTAYHLSPGLKPFDMVAYLPGGRIIPLIRNIRYGQVRSANIPAIPMTVRLVRQGAILKTLTGASPRAGRKYAAYAIGRPARNFRLLLDVTASQ